MTDQATTPENAAAQPESVTGETMTDLLNWLNKQAPTGRTVEDIEAQIREERDSWED